MTISWVLVAQHLSEGCGGAVLENCSHLKSQQKLQGLSLRTLWCYWQVSKNTCPSLSCGSSPKCFLTTWQLTLAWTSHSVCIPGSQIWCPIVCHSLLVKSNSLNSGHSPLGTWIPGSGECLGAILETIQPISDFYLANSSSLSMEKESTVWQKKKKFTELGVALPKSQGKPSGRLEIEPQCLTLDVLVFLHHLTLAHWLLILLVGSWNWLGLMEQ